MSDTKVGLDMIVPSPRAQFASDDATAAERARCAEGFERWFDETFLNRALPTDLQNDLSAARERHRRFLRGEEP